VTLEGQQVTVPQGNDGALVSFTNELLRRQGLPEMSIEYMVELQNAYRAEEVAPDRDGFGSTATLEGQQVARRQGHDEALVALTESASQSRLSTINEVAVDMCE
jgi:3,4-dihydroxy-2-butanone 4-phosphate synthase